MGFTKKIKFKRISLKTSISVYQSSDYFHKYSGIFEVHQSTIQKVDDISVDVFKRNSLSTHVSEDGDNRNLSSKSIKTKLRKGTYFTKIISYNEEGCKYNLSKDFKNKTKCRW